MFKTKFLKIFIAIIILVGLTITAGFFIVQKFKEKKTEEEKILISRPWIEIVSAQVFKKNFQTKEVINELKSGDELSVGDFIETDENGLANIYFSNGSVVRLDKNTGLLIEENNFNPQSGSLGVRIGLKVGRVWSRLAQLITADSFWEVKTSNVVATVRGTTFVVEYQEEKSSLWVAGGKVETNVIDPETKKEIEGTKTIVKEAEMVEIKKEEIKKLKEEPKKLIVRKIPREILEQDWVKQNKEADERLSEKIERIKQEIKQELKEELKEEKIKEGIRIKLKEEFIKEIKEPIEPIEPIKPIELKSEIKPVEPVKPLEPTELKLSELKKLDEKKLDVPIIDRPSLEPKIQPQNLKIVISAEKDIFTEGDIVSLKAFLIMSDDSEKDVTQECKWQVLGNIGTIEFPGSFRARLDPSVSELGEVPGKIICTWTDSQTNETFLGSTSIIKVRAKVEFDVETRG